MNYAHSKPDHRNCFEVFELENAIFQPDGAGPAPVCRAPSIVRSARDLRNGGYDKAQVRTHHALQDTL
jgi:hypothetical protein